MQYFLIFLIFISFNSFSLQSIKFSNSIDNSNWTIIKNSIFECSVQQKINNYGFFEISFLPKNKTTAIFKPYNKPSNTGNLKLSIIPFSWNINPSISQSFNVKYYSQFDIELDSHTDIIENSLISNQQIYISYLHMDNINYSVFVNPIGFNKIYSELLNCKSLLIPYSFEDIQFSVLFFEKNSNKLKNESKIILDKIIYFLKNSEDKYSITIESHSDSYGSRSHNLNISNQRSTFLKTQLESLVNDIQIFNFGEKKLVSTNQTENDRDINRRVILKINKI